MGGAMVARLALTSVPERSPLTATGIIFTLLHLYSTVGMPL